MGDSVKESEKKAKDGGEAGGNTPPGEEAKGNSKDEKSRSEEEAIKQRRLRNKVKSKKQKTRKRDVWYSPLQKRERLGKSMVVFHLFEKLSYSNERSTRFESLNHQ